MKNETVKNLCRKWRQTDTHDNISLPDWGPYSKRFFGSSHIGEKETGNRFDFFAIPSLYRRMPFLPEAKAPFNYLPWETSKDLSFYSYRQQLMWKDQIYMQGSFALHPGGESVLCRYTLVNNLDMEIEFALHLFSMLAMNPMEKIRLVSSPDSLWLNCDEYSFLSMKHSSFYEGQNVDGFRPGIRNHADAVSNTVLALGFGTNPGDKAEWTLQENIQEKDVYIRCSFTGKIFLLLNGEKLALESSTKDFTLFHAGKISGNKLVLSFASPVGEENDFLLDGICIGKKAQMEKTQYCQIPEVTESRKSENSLILKFHGSPIHYAVRFDRKESLKRVMAVPDLVDHFKTYSNIAGDPTSPYYNVIRGEDAGFDICLQPLKVKGGSREDIFVLVAKGNIREEAENLLAEKISFTPSKCRSTFANAEKNIPEIAETAYTFSQKRMQSVIMTNIVYPIRLGKEYIRHFTPGRFWDCLYTWDSGFTGLGLLETAPERAAECLNTYTYPEEHKEAAFVRHGTPLPTQILLFHELMNRSCSKDFLRYFYPRVKKMHDFLSGIDPASNTGKFSKNGILRSWKYGYNSGGWDDYPAQSYVHKNQAHHILPVITTAFSIRTAKILAAWAEELNKKEDMQLYRTQSAKLSSALQKYAWNEASGYFSYMRYDEEGNYQGHFLMEDGTDWNMGLDGVSPLIAGEVTKEQHKILWQKLRSTKHFRSKTGISTVDMSAPYFKNDGYANGVNWTAFEYFLWKTALDDAQFTDAWNIAQPALELWQKECETFYGCFEHFVIRSGRGNGWPHFSSFSTPYCCYFHAFYTPGRVTTGFDTLVLANSLTSSGGSIRIKNTAAKGGSFGILLSLEKGEYSFQFDGKSIKGNKRLTSLWEIALPKGAKGVLKVEKLS